MAEVIIIDRSNGNFVSTYEAPEPNPSQFGGPWADPEKFLHMVPPDGENSNTVKFVSDSGAKASLSYDGVTYTAKEVGSDRNGETIEFDGSQTINQIADNNNLDHDASDGTQVPPSGSADLSGGLDKERLEVDSAKRDAWEKDQNRQARIQKIEEENQTLQETVVGLIKPENESSRLMLRVSDLFTYLKALQDAAGVADADMSQDGQDAKSKLQNEEDNVVSDIESARQTRNTNVNDTDSYYPFPSNGLPSSYSDRFL